MKMDDVYVYEVTFPVTGISEAVCVCPTGYTVYIDSRLSPQGRIVAYEHALNHIRKLHLEQRQDKDIQTVEIEAHEESGCPTTRQPLKHSTREAM